MKKLLLIGLLGLLFTSCVKEKSNFRGVHYTTINNPTNLQIDLSESLFSPIDVYIIILDELVENNYNKDVYIKLSNSNTKVIYKNDVKFIKSHGIKINSYDNIFGALNKSEIIVNRIYQKE